VCEKRLGDKIPSSITATDFGGAAESVTFSSTRSGGGMLNELIP